MDEENLQANLLSGRATAATTSDVEVPNVPRDVNHDAQSKNNAPTPRSRLSPPSKGHRLFRAFRLMFTPYFRESTEGKCLFGLLFIIILISCGGKVYLSYQANYFYSALADRDIETFKKVIITFAIAMVCFVPVDAFYNFVQTRLTISWRRWLTERVLKLYFHNKVYYALERKGDDTSEVVEGGGVEAIDYYAAAANKKVHAVDNPDQRIQEDIDAYTSYSLSFFSIMVESTVDLVSFSIVLGSIMPELFIGLVTFAMFGTLFTVLIGKKLVKLNFQQLQKEADFRFSLVRIRENAESIAFYSGERVEEKETEYRLMRVIENSSWINMAQLRLNFFTIAYNRLTWILPLLIASPEYFAGMIELGVLQQARSAFDHILDDLSLLINEFLSVAQFSAGIERLFSFLNVMQDLDMDRKKEKHLLLQDPDRYDNMSDDMTSESLTSGSISVTPAITVEDIELPTSTSIDLSVKIINISNLRLATPDNKRVLIENLNLSLPDDKNLLIVGVSGAGKSSLLRAIAGLWTTGDGVIARPSKENTCFLPQRPYCPPGTLRDQLLYPSMVLSDGESNTANQSLVTSREWSDEDLLSILVQVDLPELASRSGDGDPIRGLNTKLDWTNTLSLGEQQRLAFGRIITNKPRLVIMDESTSALDVKAERKMYELLQTQKGRGLTFISVGHRPTLLAYHDMKLALKDRVGYVSEIPPGSGVFDEDLVG